MGTCRECPYRTTYDMYCIFTTREPNKCERTMIARHKALAESHPHQFPMWHPYEAGKVCATGLGRAKDSSPLRGEVQEWLDEHTPGWTMVDSWGRKLHPRSHWIVFPDLVSAMAFKFRWL